MNFLAGVEVFHQLKYCKKLIMPTMSNKDFIPIAGSAYMRFFDKLMRARSGIHRPSVRLRICWLINVSILRLYPDWQFGISFFFKKTNIKSEQNRYLFYTYFTLIYLLISFFNILQFPRRWSMSQKLTYWSPLSVLIAMKQQGHK